MEPKWEQLGRELEQARGSLKAAAVARAVGLSGTQLRNYERGLAKSGRPSAERLVALAALYGVDAQPWLDLVGYTVPRRVGGSIALVGGIRQAAPADEGAAGERLTKVQARAVDRFIQAQQAALDAQQAALDELLAAFRDGEHDAD